MIRTPLGIVAMQGLVLLSLLEFAHDWHTDLLIGLAPTIVLGLMAWSQRAGPSGRLVLVAELAYAVSSATILLCAFPGSETSEPRQLALFMIPVTGCLAIAVSEIMILLRRQPKRPAIL